MFLFLTHFPTDM